MPSCATSCRLRTSSYPADARAYAQAGGARPPLSCCSSFSPRVRRAPSRWPTTPQPGQSGHRVSRSRRRETREGAGWRRPWALRFLRTGRRVGRSIAGKVAHAEGATAATAPVITTATASPGIILRTARDACLSPALGSSGAPVPHGPSGKPVQRAVSAIARAIGWRPCLAFVSVPRRATPIRRRAPDVHVTRPRRRRLGRRGWPSGVRSAARRRR